MGALSALPSLYFWLYFWLWMLGPKSWLERYPGKPVPVLIAILCAAPLSAIAANRGNRIWYAVTAVSIGTSLFVGLRLH